MFSKLYSAITVGIEGIPIEVETHICNGLPNYHIVGLPSQVIKESKERVKAAILSCNIAFPPKKITQNMSPAHVKKEGAQLDLAIALGIIICEDKNYRTLLSDIGIIGELSLDGNIKPVRGIFSLIEGFRKTGINRIILPYDNLIDFDYYEEMIFYGYSNLKNLYADICAGNILGEKKPAPLSYPLTNTYSKIGKKKPELNFSEIIGNQMAIRAVEVAVTGRHNVLLIGPPGCGKTMIAERITSIMPEMTLNEQVELTKIYALENENVDRLINQRPVRMPHHSISQSALLGGGMKCMPGEITKAHLGVLILDEMGEFNTATLDALREPLNHGKITLSKNQKWVEFPSKFMLVATMNPCKCGYFMSSQKECTCSPYELKRHQQKLSGPLLDRIDIIIYMDRVSTEDSHAKASELIKENITSARRLLINEMDTDGVDKKLSSNLENKLKKIYDQGDTTMRGIQKIKRISKSIAALDQKNEINESHLYEAYMLHGQQRLKQW